MAKRRRTNARAKSPGRMKGSNAGRTKRATAKELERIEDLLGEDFESISQARAALARESGPVPYKDKYTVQELSTKKHRTVRTFIPDLENHKAEIDALKKENSFWAGEIYGHGTYQLFGSIEQLARKLGTYKGLQEENPQAALKNIKIVQVKGVNAMRDYYAQKKAEVEKSWRKRQQRKHADRVRQQQQARKIKSLEGQVKRLRAKLRKK